MQNQICQDWRSVFNYENLYEINSQGMVKSLHRRNPGKILPQYIDREGYPTVKLSKKGKDSTRFIHRLLAQAFIPNPENKKFVNHKNGNKLCYDLGNLEWVTHRENMIHAFKNGLLKLSSKRVIDLCSGETFGSAMEAARHYNIRYNTLRNYLNGNIKSNPTCLEYLQAA